MPSSSCEQCGLPHGMHGEGRAFRRPDLLVLLRGFRRPRAQHDAMQDRQPEPARQLDDARVGKEFAQIGAHRRRRGGRRGAEVDEEDALQCLRQHAGEQLGGDVDDRHHALVGHARRADHADGADDFAVHLVGRGHHADVVGRGHAGLAADEDLHALAAQRKVEDLDQRGLALEQLEQLLQAPHVLRQVLHREQVALAGDHVLLAALGERAAGVERRAHQLGDVLAHLAQLVLQPGAHFLEALAGVVLVDEVRRLDQLGRAVFDLGEQDPVLHVAIGRDHDQQDALLRQLEELDVLEGHHAPRRHHHAGELGELREQVRGGLDHALRVVGMQLALDRVQVAATASCRTTSSVSMKKR